MTILAERAAENRAALLERLAELDEQRALANLGGSESALARHRKRGKLTVRERIELLLDRDSPFLELSPYAAWGTDFPVGASTISEPRWPHDRMVRAPIDDRCWPSRPKARASAPTPTPPSAPSTALSA